MITFGFLLIFAAVFTAIMALGSYSNMKDQPFEALKEIYSVATARYTILTVALFFTGIGLLIEGGLM